MFVTFVRSDLILLPASPLARQCLFSRVPLFSISFPLSCSRFLFYVRHVPGFCSCVFLCTFFVFSVTLPLLPPAILLHFVSHRCFGSVFHFAFNLPIFIGSVIFSAYSFFLRIPFFLFSLYLRSAALVLLRRLAWKWFLYRAFPIISRPLCCSVSLVFSLCCLRRFPSDASVLAWGGLCLRSTRSFAISLPLLCCSTGVLF